MLSWHEKYDVRLNNPQNGYKLPKRELLPKKLTEYALNPNHPVGGNKAKVFESALGEIMKFKEYDTVKIMKDCEEGVKKGELGAILMVFEEPREAYEVEILDEEGNPKAQCTLLPDDLEFVKN